MNTGTLRARAISAAAGLAVATFLFWVQVDGVFLLPFRLPDSLILLPGFLLGSIPALVAGVLLQRLAGRAPIHLPLLSWVPLSLLAALITPPAAIFSGSLLSAAFGDSSALTLMIGGIIAFTAWAWLCGPVMRMLAGPILGTGTGDDFVATQGDGRPVIAFIGLMTLAVGAGLSGLPGPLGVVMLGLPLNAAMIPLAAYATSRRPLSARSISLLAPIWAIPLGTALVVLVMILAGAGVSTRI